MNLDFDRKLILNSCYPVIWCYSCFLLIILPKFNKKISKLSKFAYFTYKRTKKYFLKCQSHWIF